MKHQMTSGQRLDGNTPQRRLLSDDIDRLTRLLLRWPRFKLGVQRLPSR